MSEPVGPGTASVPAAPDIVRELIATRRWVMIVAVLNVLGILITLGMVGFTIVGAGAASATMLAFVAPNIFVVVLYATVASLLFRYAGSLAKARSSGTTGDVELAFSRHRQLWKFVGLLVLIGTLLTIAIGVFAAFQAASNGL